MSKEIQTVVLGSGTVVEYEIRKSRRIKRPSLLMYPDGTLIARIPQSRTALTARRLVNYKREWIERHYTEAQRTPKIPLPVLEGKELDDAKKKAREILTERVEYFNQYYGFEYKKIFVKNLTAQWGSCSSKSNLNFNFKLVFLPLELLDYVVVHELCHLKHMNHSKHFWNEVEKIMPDYKEREKKLANYILK